MVKIQPWIQ